MFFFAAISTADNNEYTMDPERLNTLIDQHGKRILHMAYMYMKDRQRAEDICQEVFIKLYRTNPDFQSDEHEKAWILRVTINLCKDQFKSFWSKRIVLDEKNETATSADTSDIVTEKEQAKQLFITVLDLPEKYKTPIILYYYQGLTSAEIANILSSPEATVRSRLKRAREKLKVKLLEQERREI